MIERTVTVVPEDVLHARPASQVVEAANNYDPAADYDDGSCEYAIFGCTDDTACNYDSAATDDNGSCEYAETGYDCAGNCVNDADGDGTANYRDRDSDDANENPSSAFDPRTSFIATRTQWLAASSPTRTHMSSDSFRSSLSPDELTVCAHGETSRNEATWCAPNKGRPSESVVTPSCATVVEETASPP